jgi:hypothetical protein
MVKITCTDRVGNEKILHGVKEDRNTLHKIKRSHFVGTVFQNTLLKDR